MASNKKARRTASDVSLNPHTTSYEFLGPPGALAVTLGVPFVMYALYYACSEASGGCPPPFSVLQTRFVAAVKDVEFWRSLWDTQAFVAYVAWYSFTVVAWALLPGEWIEGTQMRNGQRKQYKINAFATFLLALALAFGLIVRGGPQSFTFIYEHWVGLVTSSLVVSIVQALYVYLSSYQGGKLLALGGNTGNFIYDFFIGRELNPSIGSFDIKSFNELRPGLILWALIDISMACAQAVRRGGTITDSMALVLLFQIGYIADAEYNEPAVFTTMDITTDGFGFMLAVAVAWEPFVYSLQARYLVFEQVKLGWARSVAIFAVNALGYYIFRAANGEKNEVRKGKDPKNLKYMVTASGSRLITSGWWGRSRHPNYLGDLLMALAWSLPTGFKTPLTYFYVIYFLILLVHRQIRDDEKCHRKYGKDWDAYKRLVPYRIVPYVY